MHHDDTMTQEQLSKDLDKYRRLFERASDSIFIVDPLTLRILEVNPNAARRLGYSPEELIGQSYEAIEIPPDAPPAAGNAWVSTYTGARVYECVHKRKDGSLMTVEVSSLMIKIDDRAMYQNFVRDITKRKQMESEREKLIEDLDAFAQTVAHDLKNPLNIVLGYGTMVLDELDELPPDKIRPFLNHILQAGRKMGHIIDSLLILASVRQLDDIPCEALDMGAIVHEALNHLAWLGSEYQAEIILPDADSWPVALGYAPWIEEVWANYISNAIKYGGTPPRVELGSALNPDGSIRFWVRDNGQGLSPEQQARLFTQFTRLHNTQVEGHGLGLSIVRRIIEKLGGHIAVEGEIGTGSVFSFTLPGA